MRNTLKYHQGEKKTREKSYKFFPIVSYLAVSKITVNGKLKDVNLIVF